MGERGLTEGERERYRRQWVLPEVGEAGQRRLKAGSALIVGVGGLGSPIALYLAAAGVGRIGLVDADTVDVANLQRQVLYTTEDLGRGKLRIAHDRLCALNPHVEIELHEERFDGDSAQRLAHRYDVLVDGTDSLRTRCTLSDASVALRIPYVYGAVAGFVGQASTFVPGRGPCYRCVFPQSPPGEHAPGSQAMGVLGTVAGVIGCIEATETIKLLTAIGSPLIGRLLLVDALTLRFEEVRIERQPTCRSCGEASEARAKGGAY